MKMMLMLTLSVIMLGVSSIRLTQKPRDYVIIDDQVVFPHMYEATDEIDREMTRSDMADGIVGLAWSWDSETSTFKGCENEDVIWDDYEDKMKEWWEAGYAFKIREVVVYWNHHIYKIDVEYVAYTKDEAEKK
eukprot:110354_1